MAADTRTVAQQFYEAFSRHDGAAMAQCYAPTAHFEDPVFPSLDGPGAGAMWRMLTSRPSGLVVEVTSLEAAGDEATVKWTARYTFGPQKRPVENHVTSVLSVQGGLIVKQRDTFDFWRWSGQALGPLGTVLGWSPVVKAMVRRRAADQLRAWRRRQG